MTPEDELDRRMIDLVRGVREDNPECRDPDSLAAALGLRSVRGRLGPWEGGLVGGAVVVDPDRPSRRALFTAYHEIAHHLIRQDDLLALVHDQYPRQADFERACERLCNVGAAEFLVPRELVLSACREHGLGIHLVPMLRDATGASATAVCMQLALVAPHACIALVARPREPSSDRPALADELAGTTALRVEVAVSSRAMRYRIARGTPVPAGHLLHRAVRAAEGEVLEGREPIPFSSGRRWVADCEALRLRSQVFGLFHVGPRPAWNPDQVPLPFDGD